LQGTGGGVRGCRGGIWDGLVGLRPLLQEGRRGRVGEEDYWGADPLGRPVRRWGGCKKTKPSPDSRAGEDFRNKQTGFRP